MKKSLAHLLLSVSVLLPCLAVSTQAQPTSRIVKVNVPFDFVARGKLFPEGSYFIAEQGGFVYLRDGRGRAVGTFSSHPVEARSLPSSAKLVFYQYEDVHLLTQVWWEGNRVGVELVQPGTEAETAQAIAARKVITARANGRP